MERRDYLEKEIEKMQAVLQKIFRMRVDKEEEVQEIISTELVHYFDASLRQMQQMTEDEFQLFAKDKSASLLSYLGNLLYVSVNIELPLTDTGKLSLKKALFAWKSWETKTKTLDLEQKDIQNKIIALLNEQNH
jgi:hypothetical protein